MTRDSGRVLFLDDSEDLRELMAILLETTLGVSCMCFGSLREIENHSEDVMRAKVAILDINLGPDVPDGIDAFNWLKNHGFQGKIMFLTGHARSNPQVAMAGRSGAQILEKPIQTDKLISSVARALNGTL